MYKSYKGIGDSKYTIDTLPEVVTMRETANLFRVSPITVKRWCKAKKIAYFRINERGDRRFKKQDIINYLNKYENVVA